jgi:hypothetical protein
MKVEELIRILEKAPKDAEVKFWSGFEPEHELGKIDLDIDQNIVYINDAECLGIDDYIYIENDEH